MWSWINISTVIVGCTSVILCLMSKYLVIDFSNVYSRQVLANGLHHNIPSLTNQINVDPFSESHNFASSVWCLKRIDGSKMCHFKNIFYMPIFKEHLVFLLNEYSIVSGIESVESLKDINLSSIKNHSNCILKLVILKSKDYLQEQDFLEAGGNTLILKRFKPDNIMHVIHDDLLPLFLTFHDLCQGDVEHCVSSYQLLFFDDHNEGPYFEWYKIFSNHNPIFLKSKGILIRNSVIGLSQESIWFDYGFKNIQGPLLNLQFNGLFLKMFSIFIKQKFGIKQDDYHSKVQEPETVVFLNRMINRKILNGNLVEKYIEDIFENVHNGRKVQIFNMDLSINGSKSLISTLQHSNLLVGVHGSAMMLGIFMPEGSNIVEVFPFAIQPEIVSPVKAMCSLPNVYYKYSFWVNKNESNSKTHPEYPPLLGGIMHLSILEQTNIIQAKLVPPVKCCHDPLYLFRMFQDTLIDESFYSLLKEVLSYNTTILSSQDYRKQIKMNILNQWYFPPPVFNLTCECTRKQLKLLWRFVNVSSDVRFSVYISNGLSLTTNITNLSMTVLECELDYQVNNLETKKNNLLSVWVKTLEGSKESLDSYKECSYSL